MATQLNQAVTEQFAKLNDNLERLDLVVIALAALGDNNLARVLSDTIDNWKAPVSTGNVGEAIPDNEIAAAKDRLWNEHLASLKGDEAKAVEKV